MKEATFLQQGLLLLPRSQVMLLVGYWCCLCLGKGLTNCTGTREEEELVCAWLKYTQMCHGVVITFLNNVPFSPAWIIQKNVLLCACLKVCNLLWTCGCRYFKGVNTKLSTKSSVSLARVASELALLGVTSGDRDCATLLLTRALGHKGLLKRALPCPTLQVPLVSPF